MRRLSPVMLAGALATAALLSGCVSLSQGPSPSASLPLVTPPLPSAQISPAPTLPPTPTPTPTPTLEPTSPPATATPTIEPTPEVPTPTPPTAKTPKPTATPTANHLDFTADPNFGTLEVTSGFLPDPQTKFMVSGGSIDVSYIDGCSGFATAAPDYSVRYTIVGSSSLLRFYFEGDGDTTLIINDPAGQWWCSDDSYGTFDPTIDIDPPITGRYDIWIGSFMSGQAVTGTLSITELSFNHPGP